MEISTPLINQISIKIRLNGEFPSTIREIQKFTLDFTSHFGFNVIQTTYHEFKPQGITFIAILSESHIAVHTWPEYKTLHIDLVSCKNLKKEDVEAYTKSKLNIEYFEYTV